MVVSKEDGVHVQPPALAWGAWQETYPRGGTGEVETEGCTAQTPGGVPGALSKAGPDPAGDAWNSTLFDRTVIGPTLQV